MANRHAINRQRYIVRSVPPKVGNTTIEVEVVDALAVLYGVDDAQVCLDASVRRFLMNGMWCGWNDGSSSRNSTLIGSPCGVPRLPSLMDQAGLLQERAGLAQQRTILT
jgi:hypothetical protein